MKELCLWKLGEMKECNASLIDKGKKERRHDKEYDCFTVVNKHDCTSSVMTKLGC